ncbi:MAG: PEGA domain-containing protein [Polyangiaceae bacterium]
MRTPGVLAAAFVAVSLFAAPLRADDAREQSRASFRRGVTMAKENNFVAARDAFAEAYRLFPHPSILLNLGIARGKSGQLVEAEQDLVKFLADDGGASADEIKSARQMLADVRDKLATLSLDVKTSGAKATLDGKPVALVAGQPSPVRATAGQHTLHVEADGHEPLDQTVDLVSKVETPLTVELKPRAGSEGGGGGATVTTSGVSRTTIGLALVGAGVLAAGGGTYFGLSALAKSKRYNDAPTRADQDDADKNTGRTHQRLSDGFFVGALLLGAGGAYFLLVKPKSPSPAAASLVLGPGYGGVRGSF